MCACSGSCNCEEIITLPTGAAGDAGDQGLFGGFSLGWKFSTSTSTSPAVTTIRFNSTTYNLVSALYLNETNTDSIESSEFLNAFTNSSNFGLVKIFKKDDSTKFWMGTITSNTDAGTYRNLAVTYIMHNGAFAANDELVVSFAPKGATGSTGATGAAGASLYYYTATDTGHTGGGALETLKTINIPAGTLDADGRSIILDVDGTTTGTANAKTLTVQFNGVTVGAPSFTTASSQAIKIFAKVTRQSNTLVGVSLTVIVNATSYNTYYYSAGALNFTSNSYNLDIKATSTDVNGISIVDTLSYKIY